MKHLMIYGLVCIIGSLALGVPGMIPRADAYQVNLSLYNQGFNINNFYNDGEFDVEKGIVEADPSSLLIIVGDPANVETTLNIPDIPDPFELAEAGSDFHFEIAQPFRFQDRFDGLFSTTVDDPVLFVPDNGTITAFRDDGILADDRIDLNASERELPPMYVEVDYGDTITMTTWDNTRLFITQIWRNPDFSVSFNISDVPEPGTAVLLGLGVIGVIGILRRKKIKLNKIAIVFVCFLFMGLSFTETEAYAYAPGEGAPMMVGLFDFPKSAIICAFSRNAANLGVATDVAKNVQGRIYQQTFEKGIILFKGGLTAYAVHGKIYEKWVALGAENSKLGYPVKEEVGAWGSPQGNGGKVQFFKNGDIYLHESGNRQGEAFFVKGAIKAVYDRNYDFGSGGWLGLPITDEYKDGTSGWSINQFEGGCITSDDGISYSERPKEECPPVPDFSQTANLQSAVGICATSGEYLEKNNFKVTWSPYTPPNVTFTFDPDRLVAFATASGDFAPDNPKWGEYFIDLNLLPIINNVEMQTVEVTAKGGYGTKTAEIPVVNEDSKLGFSIYLNDRNSPVRPFKSLGGMVENITIGSWKTDFPKVRAFVETLEKINQILKVLKDGMNVFEKIIKNSPAASCEFTAFGRSRTANWVDNNVIKDFNFADSPGRKWEMEPREYENHGFNFAKEPQEIRDSTFDFTGGYYYSSLCCPSSKQPIKGAHEIFGQGYADLGHIACETRDIPIGSGINIGLTGEIGADFSLKINGKTTCDPLLKVCFEPNVNIPISAGIFISAIHKKIARFDVKASADANVKWKDLCYDFGTGKGSRGNGKFCYELKASGSVTLFSFVKRDIGKVKLGKDCPVKF